MKNSDYIINSIVKEISNKNLSYNQNNKFDFTGKGLDRWKRTTSYALNLFKDNEIDYCLIKAYDIPNAYMDDIDILIEDKPQLSKLYDKLLKLNFKFTHVPFNDNMKISARNNELDVEIDFYPDAKWGDLRYAKPNFISKHKRMNKKHGIDAMTPKAEHEIYMIASHAYGHVRTNLLEVLNTIKIIIDEDPDFEEIIQLAEKFHLQNPTLVLLSLANNFMIEFGVSSIEKKYLDKLKNISNKHFIDISNKKFGINDFPFKYSMFNLVSSSIDKFTANNLDETAVKTDELNGFIKHNRMANAIYTRFLSSHYGNYNPGK
jgi:hypothetical protein